jgi:V/A-type H+-transporting ATPase subunit K
VKLTHKLTLGLVILAGVLSLPISAVLFAPQVFAAEAADAAQPVMEGIVWSYGLIGAALATGLSSLGAGMAVARVGAAAIGTMAEKPELFGRMLIVIGLAEGIAIYGLIISILILNRLV